MWNFVREGYAETERDLAFLAIRDEVEKFRDSPKTGEIVTPGSFLGALGIDCWTVDNVALGAGANSLAKDLGDGEGAVHGIIIVLVRFLALYPIGKVSELVFRDLLIAVAESVCLSETVDAIASPQDHKEEGEHTLCSYQVFSVASPMT